MTPIRTASIATLGCKLNQSESDAMARQLAEAGIVLVPFGEPADLCVVNSCTVTHIGDRKSRQLIRQAARSNPEAFVAVAGCYAELDPTAVAQIDGVRAVLGNAAKERLVEALRDHGVEVASAEPSAPTPLPRSNCSIPPAPAGKGPGVAASPSRARAFVKIQEGCDSHCSYCIVPKARGHQRSVPADAVVAEIRRLEVQGCREVVLTGVNITAYGRDHGSPPVRPDERGFGPRLRTLSISGARGNSPTTPPDESGFGQPVMLGEAKHVQSAPEAPPDESGFGQPVMLGEAKHPLFAPAVRPDERGFGLLELLRRILAETDIPRIRLTSLQPEDWSPRFYDLWGSGRLCRHLHLSLQSGCDAVLKRMHRRYNVDRCGQIVSEAKQALPGVAVTADVIVGFPGETGGEFEETESFLRYVGFARLHVFKYSPRSGTPAAVMPDQVDPRVKQARSARLIALSDEMAGDFRSRYVGSVLPVLWEEPLPDADVRRLGLASNGSASDWWTGLSDSYIRAYARRPSGSAGAITSVLVQGTAEGGVWGAPTFSDGSTA